MSAVRTLDDLLLYDYGRQLYDVCNKHNWNVDSLMAFYYDLPRLIAKAEESEKKRAEKLKVKSKQFPEFVDEQTVIKALELTPWIYEKRVKHGLLKFKNGKFSGKLLGEILFIHRFPEYIENRQYSFPEVMVLTQIQETKLKSKYTSLFNKEPMWWWSKEEVVEVMLTKKNKLKVL